MANPEHLAKLLEGVDVWNRWREEHIGVVPDLSDADLRVTILGGADFSGANLSEAQLIGADLFNAQLIGADLSWANFRGANLRKANLREARLLDTTFGNTDLSEAKGLDTCDHDGPSMLFPVRLVNFETLRNWKCFDADTGTDSAREIREYFIPDFSNWKNHDSYQEQFDFLLRDLKAEA